MKLVGKLVGRIPVEALDDERLTNIERRVVAGAADAAARAHRQRVLGRHAGRLVVAAAMVAAGAVGWALHRAPANAPVIAEPTPIRVETDPRRSVLDIGDARIESDPATVFAVTRPAGGVLVAMTRGKVELEVGKRGGRPPLIVRAGDTDVVVVGTHFTVDYGDGHGDVAVRVTEGIVRVVHQQQETRVAAGQAWRTHAGLIASAEPGAHASPAVPGAGDAGHDGDAATPSGEDSATLRAHAGSAIALGQAPDVLHDRTAAVPVAPGVAPPPPPRLAAAPARPLGSDAARAHAVAKPEDPHIDLTAAIRAQRVEPALDLHEPNPASAVARYYAIAAHTSGEDAAQAFYSIAVLRHTRLGRNADALQTLDAYVRRFPGGKEYRAVLWLRVRILCLDKIDDRCRAAAYTYLHEAPDDPAAHVAELVTMTQ
jgi:FecR-like protein